MDINKIRQQKAFKVPENYFTSFEEKMMRELSPIKEEREFSWFDQIIYQLQLRFSIPALMVASLALIIIYINLDMENQRLSLNDEEIKSYLVEEYDDQIEENIYALVSSQEKTDYVFSDEEILEYLHQEEIEEEILTDYLP